MATLEQAARENRQFSTCSECRAPAAFLSGQWKTIWMKNVSHTVYCSAAAGY